MGKEVSRELEQQLLALGEDLREQLRSFQELSRELMPRFAEMASRFAEATLESQAALKEDIASITDLAREVTEKTAGFADTYARQLTEISQTLAAGGSEQEPMADRILAMARQIGLMADRIGEMSDRILFMADKIVAYGNRIVYVIQLTVYTEQMMVNFGTLLNHLISNLGQLQMDTLSRMATRGKDQPREDTDDAGGDLVHMYGNMNRMLDHMHAFSMKLLDNEAEMNRQQVAFRDQQAAHRRDSLEAGDGADPDPDDGADRAS